MAKSKARVCPICGGALKTRREDHPYTECGLENVVLVGIRLHSCGQCGEELLAIPRLTELHRVIALALATQEGRLRGAEIRFLRKHLGHSGVDFAHVMGVDPATVSRWEHSKEPIGPTADRLVRLMVLRSEPDSVYPTGALADVARDGALPISIGVRVDRGEWRAKRAA